MNPNKTQNGNRWQYRMLQSMRWYGPGDAIALRDIAQAGSKGVVTALHQVPVGEVWELRDIQERLKLIEDAGLHWTAVESLPVHEDIKRKSGNHKLYVENYGQSLRNLAQCGLNVVAYNFMPVLDWVRTQHAHENSDGTKALRFDWIDFVYFDVFLLQRPGAEADYSHDQLELARSHGNNLTEQRRQLLFDSVLLGLPGSKEKFSREGVLGLLEEYRGIDESTLRGNLIDFLKQTVPVAETLGIQLAIHPDDPPFSVLGLPRVVSTQRDLEELFKAVPATANGLCYCTGSLGADPNNDLLEIIDRFGQRIHFLHLRNVKGLGYRQFMEAEHLEGDGPMEDLVERLLRLMQQRGLSLPMRPDHGFLHSYEREGEQYPGYSLIGRLKGLAELRGLERGIIHSLKNEPKTNP